MTVESSGHTILFYTTDIKANVDAAMREAIAFKQEMFNLPEETFSYPIRPWEIRNLAKKKPETYQNYQPIITQCTNPKEAWSLRAEPPNSEPMDEDETSNTQVANNFFFCILECHVPLELLCFKQQSTIQDAGYGLFL